MKNFRILAVVPARGGSKRLPGKNIRLLGGKPLINWTIESALKSGCFEDVIVSTDDQKTAKIASQAGASLAPMRPESLSTDTASSVDVVIHVVEEWEKSNGKLDAVMLLQPTSPLRKVESIRNACTLFKSNGGNLPVVSMSEVVSHPAWCFTETTSGMEPLLGWELVKSRSQNLPKMWCLNGSIYLTSVGVLKEYRSLLVPGVVALKTSDLGEAIDIDYEADFVECENIIKMIKSCSDYEG